MDFRVLNLDGSIPLQEGVRKQYRRSEYDFLCWGPLFRGGCGTQRFLELEGLLDRYLGPREDPGRPFLSFLGSGDFHHLSLALLRRLREPFNLVVFDGRADWQPGLSKVRANGWLAHAVELPLVRRVFLIGPEHGLGWWGSWNAPWDLVQKGKVIVLPARQTLRRGPWKEVLQQPVRSSPNLPVSPRRLEELLAPYLADLERWPLYLSLDKSVLSPAHAVVNGKPGILTLEEVQGILEIFLNAAEGNLAGLDMVGDWSPAADAWLWLGSNSPSVPLSRREASRINQKTNLALLDLLPVEPSRGGRKADARSS